MTRAIVDLAESHQEFERIGEVKLKGFSEPTELYLAIGPDGADAARRLAAMSSAASRSPSGCARRACCPPRAPVVVLLSGGRDSVCLLDLAVLRRGPGASAALHVNYGLRAESGADQALCEELCRRLEVPLTARSWRRRRGRATSTPGRATCATARAAPRGGARRAARRRPHRHRPGRDDPLPPRRLARPPGAARDAVPGGLLVRPLLRRGQPRGDGRLVRGPGLAWREDASNAEPPSPAPASATGSSRRCASCTPPRRRTCCAPPSCCATRRRCSTRWSTRRSPAGAGRSRSSTSPRCRRRCAPRRAAPGRWRRRATGPRRRQPRREVAGLRRTGTAMLDLGGDVRAVAERGGVYCAR